MSTKDSRARSAGSGLSDEIRAAVAAARDKKASDVLVLDLSKAGAFTDYFMICSGQSVRQLKAIADSIEQSLARLRVKLHVEGYGVAEWVLLDYFHFVVTHLHARHAAFLRAGAALRSARPRCPFPPGNPPTALPRP